MPSNHVSNEPYHEWLAEQGRKNPTPLERCFACGVETHVPITLPREYRYHYCTVKDQQYCKGCWDSAKELSELRQ